MHQHAVPEAPAVPGDRASTVNVASFLNSLPRRVLRSKCTFAGFLRDLIQSHGSNFEETSLDPDASPSPMPF